MTKDALITEIKQTLTKSKAAKISELTVFAQGAVADLIEVTFDSNRQIAFRAAWILEHVFDGFRDAFIPHLKLFLTSYPLQTNDSCQRHFSKIMMDISRDTDLVKRDYDLFEPIIESTFNWLIDPNTPVAVKVNCLDILAHLSVVEEWIVPELKEQIQFLLKDGSAAMQSRGKKVLIRLNKL